MYAIRSYYVGEDPMGTAKDKAEVEKWFAKRKFVVVQDYFMTETAKMADVVLPASFNFETGGSFTNTQKYIQQFEKCLKPKTELDNLEQLAGIFKKFGIEQSSDSSVIFDEISTILANIPEYKPEFVYTEKDSATGNFNHSCDISYNFV